MDRRRFYTTNSLTESLSSDQRRSLFEDAMSELNKLYEEDENPAPEATAEPVETEIHRLHDGETRS